MVNPIGVEKFTLPAPATLQLPFDRVASGVLDASPFRGEQKFGGRFSRQPLDDGLGRENFQKIRRALRVLVEGLNFDRTVAP